MTSKNETMLVAQAKEEVALKLFFIVGEAEDKIYSNGQPKDGIDRTWVLDTYAECLRATSGER